MNSLIDYWSKHVQRYNIKTCNYMVRTSWKSITQMTHRILYAQNFEAQKLPVLL